MADSAGERIIPGNPAVVAGGRVLASPIQFYLDGADSLRLEGWNVAPNSALQLSGRFLDETKGLVTFEHILRLTDDRVLKSLDIPMGRGYVLNLNVLNVGLDNQIDLVVPTIYQTFARVTLRRGYTGATTVLGTMLQGYVTKKHGLGWPGSPIAHSADGDGYVRHIVGSTPAPGSNIAEAVPFGARWKLLWLSAGFTTSAIVSNRYVQLRPGDGIQVYGFIFQQGPQTAGISATYFWAPTFTLGGDAANAFYCQALPDDLVMTVNDTIKTGTINIQAGDQWTAPRFGVREWLEIG